MRSIALTPKSIVTKLLVLNGIILLAFGGSIFTNVALARQVKNMIFSLVDYGVDQVIANEKLGREINYLSSEIHILVQTFTLEDIQLTVEASRISDALNHVFDHSIQNDILAGYLSRFADEVNKLLDQCRRVDALTKRIETAQGDIKGVLNQIEITATQDIITYIREGRDYEVGSIEQISVLVPDLRHLLLNIKMSISKSERAHLKRKKVGKHYENRILDLLNELESSLFAVISAGERLAPLGRNVIRREKQLRGMVIELHQVMRELQSNLNALYAQQVRVEDKIEAMGKNISKTTNRLRSNVVTSLRSYGNVMVLLALLALLVSILVAFYGARITKPIRRLTRSAAAIASGDLEEDIEIEGNDEITVLSRSFARMREAIKEKMIDLSNKNEALMREIDSRMRAEEELRKYEQIVSSSKDLMAILDRGYVYQAINESHTNMHQKRREEIVGHTIADILGEDFFNRNLKRHFDKCAGGEVVNFQEWYEFPGIGKRYMDVVLFPFIGKNESVSGFVVNARDSTTTKQLQTQLSQAQKMEAIGTLAGGIAHDFNNILGVILGYTELLLAPAPAYEEDEKQEWLSQILTAAKRAKELVQQILAFSRQREYEIKPLELLSIVDEAIKMLRASLPSTIEIRKDINAAVGAVLADPIQIHQVLINLCTNSAHAMQTGGGQLTIGLEDFKMTPEVRTRFPDLKENTYAKLTVKDTGHGIPKEYLDRIFEPYFTTKDKGVGTGLGLATVHGIIQSYGGAIDVQSEPDVGTTFTLFFPKASPVEEKRQLPDPQDEIMLHGKGRILIVDDEKALLQVVARMLKKMEYDVVACTSSVEALEIFSSDPQRFDLVLTDKTMPKLTGDELAKKILKLRSDVPIIICTGFSEGFDEEQAAAIGIRQFLKKPITMRNLAEAIRKAM